jgi:arabinogalactan oligomer/maltooligosaccharide transport system permease protein
MKGKIKHILKAVASGFVWGLGQLFNRQYLKALFFLLFFAVFVTIELSSSRYFTGYDPYNIIPSGEDIRDTFAAKFLQDYKYDVETRRILPIPTFEEFVEENKQDGLSINELIKFTAQDLKEGSSLKYYLFSEELRATTKGVDRESDLIPGEDDELIKGLLGFTPYYTTYESPEGNEYLMVNQGTSLDPINVYININDETDVLKLEEISGFLKLDRQNKIFRNSDYTKYYVEVVNVKVGKTEIIRYENISDRTDVILAKDFDLAIHFNIGTTTDAIFYNGNQVYGYFDPEGRGGFYRQTPFSKYLGEAFTRTSSTGQSGYTQDDYARYKLRVYFEIHPDKRVDFEKTYDNFFYDRAGFFLKGLWSVITLGTAERSNYSQISKFDKAIDLSKVPGTVIAYIPIRGHLSSTLLISGLIAVLLLMMFLIIMVWNIRDAYKTSIEYEKTKVHVRDKIYFKKLWEGSFEYIVLSPAFFALTFISIMPILFGFFVAFTSYNGQKADIGLFDWVGFRNFIEIFSFGENVGIPFARTFWSVFIWTIIWAVLSTATVFFGGFFQAVVISSERVPLKKFWRTVFILPWAIPAIITQMVFANIFNEFGVVNQFFNDLGLNQIFIDWGWLTESYEKFKESGVLNILYLGGIDINTGKGHIQWFTNPHNKWFVRGVLVVVNIWLGFPYYMALITSTMTGIDRTLYEAADIDGSTKNQKFKFITYPLVMSQTAPLLVMAFSGNFNNFGMIYFVTQGGQNKGFTSAFAGDTDILVSWMYTLTVDEKYYNMASVFSIIIFVIVGSIAAWNYSRTRAFKED